MTDPLSADLASLRIDRSPLPETIGRRGHASPGSGRALRSAALVLTLGAAAAGVVLVAPRARALVNTPQVTTTPIVAVSAATQETSLTSSGYVVAQKTSHVGSKVMGRLSRVLVKEGDVVRAGDVLAVLDVTDTRASMVASRARAAAAAARVETARASLAETQQQTARDAKLASDGAIPRAAFEDLEKREESLARAVSAASAEAKAASADLAPLAVMLDDHTIRAPIAGLVTSKPMEEGDIVTPGGSPVVELFDPASLVVETDVPEARLGLAHPGAPCEISLDAFPSKHFRGEVLEIGHKVDRAKATIVVKVRFLESTDGVLPDMSARTNFLTKPLTDEQKSAAPVRTVASRAIVDRGGRKVVFVVEGDTARTVAVTPGATRGDSTELVDGPAAGAKVVADPPPSLEDSQTIHEKRD